MTLSSELEVHSKIALLSMSESVLVHFNSLSNVFSVLS